MTLPFGYLDTVFLSFGYCVTAVPTLSFAVRILCPCDGGLGWGSLTITLAEDAGVFISPYLVHVSGRVRSASEV